MKAFEKVLAYIFGVILVVCGSYLFFVYYIDGTLVNQPYTFYYDTQNVQTDKMVYMPGEWVYIKVKTCIHRRVHVITRIVLKDNIEIPYADPLDLEQPVTCFGVNKPLLFRFKQLPIILAPDLSYRLYYETDATLSTGRVIHYSFRTQSFSVR